MAAKDVPVGGGVILASQNVVVTRPDKGTFEGFSATCTHQGCTLASVASGTINCGCHGSQFAITDGANVAGPSGSPGRLGGGPAEGRDQGQGRQRRQGLSVLRDKLSRFRGRAGGQFLAWSHPGSVRSAMPRPTRASSPLSTAAAAL